VTLWKSFDDIDAWQSARALANAVYEISRHARLARDFALNDQIRRAAISVMANIAEGFERRGNREFIRFLMIAKASAAELQSHLYLALDRHYVDTSTFMHVTRLRQRTSSLIGGLILHLERTGQGKGGASLS